jgi:hypothetical protein
LQNWSMGLSDVAAGGLTGFKMQHAHWHYQGSLQRRLPKPGLVHVFRRLGGDELYRSQCKISSALWATCHEREGGMDDGPSPPLLSLPTYQPTSLLFSFPSISVFWKCWVFVMWQQSKKLRRPCSAFNCVGPFRRRMINK